MICQALDRVHKPLKEGDVVVVAQSVISRSEGNVVRLEDVVPSQEAMDYAVVTGKDPRVVQVVLDESRAVVLATAGFMICETRSGLVCANAGVDASNNEAGFVSKLPKDPDASARAISDALKSRTGWRYQSSSPTQRAGRSGVAGSAWPSGCTASSPYPH